MFLAQSVGLCGLALTGGLEAAPKTRQELFLKLSSRLTGFSRSELQPTQAQLYLERAEIVNRLALDRMLHRKNLEALPPEEESLARHIIELWYSGILPTDSGSKVASFADALAWKALPFCLPPTYCGPAWWK